MRLPFAYVLHLLNGFFDKKLPDFQKHSIMTVDSYELRLSINSH